MKQFLYIFFLGAAIGACNDNTETAGRESTTPVKEEPSNDLRSNTMQSDINDVDVDTLGMAEFLAYKAAQAGKQKKLNGIQSDDLPGANDVNVDTIGFAAFKRMKAETASRAYDDSVRRAQIITEHKQYNGSGNSDNSSTKRSSKQSKSADETVSSNQTGVAKETPAPEKEKKGWSKKAKGAVIGAATGAAAGAILNKKNRGVGGVVGGVVGAAAGYGIGRQKDKKNEKEGVKKDTTDEQQ